ncbi:MAG: tRNA (guanosine(46)-N7)-methyltransferase TrmB [Proteobacteria bacterium]|nr:tRNA (guanosine(46)-N7)-methyltransferase TrmB [Pseudomonadota bacterium]
MGKKKLGKYAAAKELANIIAPNVIDHQTSEFEATWDPHFFGNSNPVTLELGCGKGEFTVTLARKYPQRNFIGVDIKSDRMLMGARKATEEGLDNLCFVRLRIECLAAYFPENMFSEGFITFPDPHASSTNGKRRLTSGRFLALYKQVFVPGSRLHLKTDSTILYDYSRESIGEHAFNLITATDNLYGAPGEFGEITDIQTTYEKRYLSRSKTIKYILFSL